MVMTLVIPMRKILGLEKYITVDHFERLAKVMLFTSLIVSFSYAVEWAMAYYSGNPYETFHFSFRLLGDYRYFYWMMVLCNSILPLLVFFKKFRSNLKLLFVLSIFVNIGMWLERFVIIVTSLARDYDPNNWGNYYPSLIEVGITVGSFGMFFTFFLIFTKVLPVLSVTEVKEQQS